MGGQSGFVVPNHQLAGRGGGGSTTINVTVNAKDAVLTHTVRQWVAEGVQQATLIGWQIGAGRPKGA